MRFDSDPRDGLGEVLDLVDDPLDGCTGRPMTRRTDARRKKQDEAESPSYAGL